MFDQVPMTLESEAGFKALFEYATIGILVISHDGKIQLANPCVEKLFGYDSEELIGEPLEILIPDSFKKRHQSHREGFFDRPKAREMGSGLDLFALKKSGEEFPVEISLGHYRLDNERLAVAFVTDVTERRKYNEQLELKVRERTLELTLMLEREKELNEIKSRFVSMASHEFRTPLSAILSSISLVETYTKMDDEEKRIKHVERIKSSVKNLTDILNNFLSLDKLEQGKVEMTKELFDLKEFGLDIIEDVKGMLKPGQEIICEHSGELQTVQDKKILRNVLLNLLSNAIKYSGENQQVIMSCRANPFSVEISVKDQGIGIPMEEQKNLFGKFYRARNAVNHQGTGLGLNIVKRYIDILDGDIRFVSEPDKGTEFVISYPHKIKL
jgi:PAS domain S-box-containing protein